MAGGKKRGDRPTSDSVPRLGGGVSARQLEERHEPLQAVVLADDFETRFAPFTAEKPRCLLPLVNRPLIDYTLEALEYAGIEEVILYSGAHSDQLEKYLDGSKWRSSVSPFQKFRFIKSTSASVGDVMRDLHEKHLMTGDFVVIHGDVVTNYPIEKAIKVHKARRLKDKNAIMTMVLRQIGISQRTKSAPNSPIFVIDPTTDRCLGYDEITPRPRGKSGSAARESSQFLELDANLLDEFPELDICNDLYDCGIDVCTPEVLGLWADSFDYQTPRTQLLCGVLKDYELNGKTIHTHVIKDNYAARAHNVKAYDAVSKDIISRWTYPFCPDMNLGEDPSRYAFKRRQVYLAQDVNVSRLAVVSRDSVIGPKTAVGDETAISDSVIGKNCRIGKNVVLENAYLWDGVVVGDNTEIKHAIVANGAVIGAGCHLEPGCLVSYGVKISDGITVPAGLRITKAVRDPAVPTDTKLVGPEGEGYEYVPEDDVEETEDPSTASLMYNMADLSLSSDSISTLASQDWDEDIAMRSRTGSFGVPLNEEDAFRQDAIASIYDGLKEDLSADVVQLELVGLRMSANASEHQVRIAVVSAFMKWIQQLIDDGTPAGEAVHNILKKYKDIFDRIVFDHDNDDKPDQVDLLLLFQKDIAERTKGETILLFMAKELYDLEIVDEEAFPQWWEHEESTSTDALKNVRVQTQPFIDWLASADSESEEDEEEEETEEDEE